jgi:hypothetical protein
MALKKQHSEGEIVVFDEAIIYKRGDYWQRRMWLAMLASGSKPKAVPQPSTKPKLISTSLKAAESQGKTYFSLTTKDDLQR